MGGAFSENEKNSYIMMEEFNLEEQDEKTLKKLKISGKGITSLDCSKYRDLKRLDCSENRLTRIVHLENLHLLARLQISFNLFRELPDLHHLKNLVFFDCTGNRLTVLPRLPASIRELYCGNNKITEVDIAPYKLLEILSVEFLALKELKTATAVKLRDLSCNNCGLKNLPDLAQNTELEILKCNSNNLEELDISSLKKLRILHCYSNRLRRLSHIPSSLETLLCGNNHLTALPPIPEESVLSELVCANNDLETLPTSLCACSRLKWIAYENNPDLRISGPIKKFLSHGV